MAMTPEGRVKLAVRKRLKALGYWHYFPVQNGLGCVGIPDVIGCKPVTITSEMVGKTIGVFFAVETKAPGKLKNTTPNQRKNIDAINAHFGHAEVVDDAEKMEIVTWPTRSTEQPRTKE